jgi:hypothetical protein
LVPLAVRLATPAANVVTENGLALRLPAITIGGSRTPAGISADVIILTLLLGMSALALCRLAMAHARLRREARSWEAGQVDGVDVLLSESTGPAVTGWLHPSIVVPRWAAQLAPGAGRSSRTRWARAR